MKKIIAFLILSCSFTATVFAQYIKVSYPATAFNGTFSGKVLLYLSKDEKEPMKAASGMSLAPCFAISVKNIKPGQAVVFDDAAFGYPAKLSDIERGVYYLQAVWDRNLGGRAISQSAGNLYSKPASFTFDKDYAATISLDCTEVIAAQKFIETPSVKELKVASPLLSGFHKMPVTINAAVLLPAGYEKQKATRYPVVFVVAGFGGDYHRYSGDATASQPMDTFACIRVFLDGNCSLGHSVYANSDNNGPWGDALVQDFIPTLEKQFRCNGARLLTGHSSGGFSVLWLQTHYPTSFIACTSSAPDPVDFRSFTQVDLYNDSSFYYGKNGSLNSVGTVAGRIPWVSFKNMYRVENVQYRGEQLHSFDAVFSKKSITGEPEPICDVATGKVNKAVVEYWKKYDISIYLQSNWNTLQPDLEGKIRVSIGLQDNFLLNYGVVKLEEEMKKLKANIQFAYYPGDHFTVNTKEYRKDMYDFLRTKYLEWLAKK